MITGIYEKRDDIFDKKKRAMSKYFGSERAGIAAKVDINIKDEVFDIFNEYSRKMF